jgi:hypothetical protein
LTPNSMRFLPPSRPGIYVSTGGADCQQMAEGDDLLPIASVREGRQAGANDHTGKEKSGW